MRPSLRSCYQPPKFDTLRIVDVHDSDCGASGGLLSNEHRAAPFKMIAPDLLARIKKRYHLIRDRINPAEVGSFVPIAKWATKRQICVVVFAVVFSWDDVIDWKSLRMGRLGELAILAAIAGAITHKLL